jgi:hypothetical protein
MFSKIRETVRSLPYKPLKATAQLRRTTRRRSERQVRAVETMVALEEKLRAIEEELLRLRVENEQLRRSSKAFGELAERLSLALKTATRVDRRATAADSGARRRALPEA